MRVHEQVYTSAPQLLEGGGNLGVVAESRGFPRALTAPLKFLRGYTMLPELGSAEPARHPARLVAGLLADKEIYAVTRTVFAGADHTGRTTPLTHQLLVSVAEATRESQTASTLLRYASCHCLSSWRDEPRWIDPPNEFKSDTIVERSDERSERWADFIPWIADSMIQFGNSGRALVLTVQPDGAREVVNFIATALGLLPPSLQWGVTIATHVATLSDFVRDASVVVTYPNSSLLEQCRQRRDSRAPRIIDLSEGHRPDLTLSGWGQLMAKDLQISANKVRDRSIQFDELNLTANDVDLFAKTAQLARDIAAAPQEATSAQWRSLAERLVDAGSNPQLQDWLAHDTVTAISTLAADDQSASRWTTLSLVAGDPRWPRSARETAISSIFDGGNDAIDTFLAESGVGSPEAVEIGCFALAARPAVARSALDAAITTGSRSAIDRAVSLLLIAPYPIEDAARAIGATAGATTVLKQLRLALLKSLSGILDQPETAFALCDQGSTHGNYAPVAAAFVLPLLRQKLQSVNDSTWRDWLETHRKIAIKSGESAAEARWLFREFKRELNAADVTAWQNHPGLDEEQRSSIRDSAVDAGLIVVVIPQLTQNRIPLEERQAGPVGQRDRRRSIRPPMPRHESAGPVRIYLSLCLFVFLLTAASGLYIYFEISPRNALNFYFAIGAAAVLCVALFLELLLRLIVRAPESLAYARRLRWAMVLLLLIAMVAGGFPAGRSLYLLLYLQSAGVPERAINQGAK